MSELRVDNIVSQDGSAAPIYSKGIRIAVGQTLTNDGDFVVGGATSISGSLRVTGGSINVTGGITTLGGQVNINNFNVTGVATFSSPLNVSNATFTGVTTYSGRANFNSGITVTGGSNVSGVATFANVTNFSAGIDVTGHTELDNVNSSGVVTATSFHTGAEGSAIRVTSNTISGPAEMFIDPAAVGDNTGALRIKGDLYVDGTQTYINSTTLEVADYNVGIATTVGTNIVLDGAGIGIGSTGIRKTLIIITLQIH